MSKLFDFKRPKAVTPTQDDEIWGQLRQSLREQFPNPQRNGCPRIEVLKRLAQGGTSLNEAEEWLDHFSQCSPCFRDFEELQLREKNRRKVIWAFAATAAIALSSSLALWLIYNHEKAMNAKAHVDSTGSRVAHVQQVRPPTVSLHLEDVSTNRGADSESAASVPRLPRGLISLFIYLPAGSEAGTYEIEILRQHTNSAALAKFEGIVQVENSAAVLRATPDLSGLEPGNYVLAFRPLGGWWRYSGVAIS